MDILTLWTLIKCILPSAFREKLRGIANVMAQKVSIRVGNLKYKAVDVTSLYMLLMLRSRRYEPHIQKILCVKPGDVFIDVGAHIGIYTVMMAKRVGKSGLVIAVEPSLSNFRVLCLNLMLNKVSNVVIPIRAAAYSRTTMVNLYIGEDSSTHSIKRLSLIHI